MELDIVDDPLPRAVSPSFVKFSSGVVQTKEPFNLCVLSAEIIFETYEKEGLIRTLVYTLSAGSRELVSSVGTPGAPNA
jgi:hypothetical protein